MAALTVASKADGGLVLPTILATTYIAQGSPQNTVHIEYKEVDSLGKKNEKVILTTSNGDSIVDGSVVPYLMDQIELLKRPGQREVDEWVNRSAALAVPDFQSLDGPIKELESHLSLRSYIVSYSLTLADIMVWGALRGNKVTVKLRQIYRNINRWFNFIEASNPWVTAVVAALSNAARQKKAAASAAGANYNIGLKNTENGIVTRFPPEPSGYLHIGHAKAALLNDYFAHEYLGPDSRGVLICRFDDTNPSKESQEFQESILEDLSLLGIQPDRISYSSDYFQQMYEGCVKLIQSGKAYADNTPKDIMKDQRGNGVPSVNRDMSVEDSLAHFEKMKAGTGLEWCIRAKISVDDPVKCLRDPVIYRCNLQPHHRTRTAWKIYPTYDFCAPFLDSLEGVTHALRTNEYRDRNPQYSWIQDALGIRTVQIWDFSRLNFVRTVLSKRKLTVLVDNNVVWGWDDPRMPTVRGIRRRGMTVPALREFILRQGPSQNVINLDWSLFWATNKKYIDSVAPRHTAVPKDHAVTAIIHGVEKTSTGDKPKHNKNAALGTKKVFFSREVVFSQEDARSFKPNEEITLMNWGNAIVTRISADESGIISALELQLHLDGDFKKTEKKVTWLAKEASNMIPVRLFAFDHLITKDKLEKEDDLFSFLTPKTEFLTEAWADCNVTSLAKDDIVQFDRVGFFRVDRAYQDGEPAVLFSIPTGKAA
ncbi:glutamyl-tRNA synthetase [Aspergillus steynii IBT 23096]|uniref:glutamate--tRNA ligase n=1 Tax=Aspergillus steynii IBT 23096 TaxID=1392250 RepID=A0A2I2FYH7_9EURO|nr:glutamyl-tRNA synthetase [Aspergillus steynii IBT 23096]PLB45689.1 glutamyl-tRNA synthetase [Aspergillus steynii IBT 23096]